MISMWSCSCGRMNSGGKTVCKCGAAKSTYKLEKDTIVVERRQSKPKPPKPPKRTAKVSGAKATAAIAREEQGKPIFESMMNRATKGEKDQ